MLKWLICYVVMGYYGIVVVIVEVMLIMCSFDKLCFGLLVCMVLLFDWLEDNWCWLVVMLFLCDFDCKL